jgi:hypothetical protein
VDIEVAMAVWWLEATEPRWIGEQRTMEGGNLYVYALHIRAGGRIN